jgi:hypothetical protein
VVPRSFIIILTILLAVVVSTGQAGQVQALESDTSFEDIARVIETFFPTVEGRVGVREGDQVTLKITGATHLVPGILMTVVRPSLGFHHPLTGEIMGHYEEEVGMVQLLQGAPESQVGRVVQEKGKIQAGDIIRLSSARLPLAVVTLTDWDKGLFRHELATALRETGRFSVVEPADEGIFEGMSRQGINPSLLSRLSQMGEMSHLHYLVLLETQLIADVVRLSLQLHVVPWSFQLAELKVEMKLSPEDRFVLAEDPQSRSLLQRNAP